MPAFLLLTLAHGPGHGAALATRMRERLPVTGVDSAAIYRTLAALEDAGEIVGEWDTSGRGPAKKTYRLTERGWQRLEYWRQDILYRVRLLTTFLEDVGQVLPGEQEEPPCKKP